MAQKYVYNAAEKDCLNTDTNSNYILEKLDIKIEEDCDRFYENAETLQDVIGIKQEPPDVVNDAIENNKKSEYYSDSENQSNFDRPIDIKQEELIIKSEIDLPKKRKHYQCDYCNYSTKSIADFRRHTVAIHDRKNAEIFRCIQCDFVTCHKRNLNRHFRIHSDNQLFTCKVCNKGFSTKQLLDNHLLKHHPDQTHLITSKVYSCDICQYSTICRTRLEHHMYNRHLKTREDVYTCHNCNFKFTCKESLRYHIFSKHSSDHSKQNRSSLQCKFCEYKTLDKSNLAKHLRTHSAERKSYKCCNKNFMDKKGYDNHILKIHPEDSELMKTVTHKIKKCEICGFQTSVVTNFKCHVKRHCR